MLQHRIASHEGERQMTTETLTKEAAQAVEYFEKKLAFEIGPVGLKYALQNKEPLTIVDLRTPELFAQSHVPGAINLSYEELEKTAPSPSANVWGGTSQLSKERTTVVYCYGITCHLAAKAALLIAKKGFPVKELYGGFDSWAEAELPVEGKQAKGSSCHSSCG